MLTREEVLIMKILVLAPAEGYTVSDVEIAAKGKLSITTIRRLLLQACEEGIAVKENLEFQAYKHKYTLQHYTLTPVGHRVLVAIHAAEKAFRQALGTGPYGIAASTFLDNTPWFKS